MPRSQTQHSPSPSASLSRKLRPRGRHTRWDAQPLHSAPDAVPSASRDRSSLQPGLGWALSLRGPSLPYSICHQVLSQFQNWFTISKPPNPVFSSQLAPAGKKRQQLILKCQLFSKSLEIFHKRKNKSTFPPYCFEGKNVDKAAISQSLLPAGNIYGAATGSQEGAQPAQRNGRRCSHRGRLCAQLQVDLYLKMNHNVHTK